MLQNPKATSIVVLDLSRCELQDNHVIELSKALACNKYLKYLELSNNDITDKGAVSLAAALATNAALSHVYIKKNKIGDEGAAALAKVFTRNHTIQYFNIYHNEDITTAGYLHFAEALAQNKGLQRFKLTNKRASKEIVHAFINTLENNTTLTHLHIGESKETNNSRMNTTERELQTLLQARRAGKAERFKEAALYKDPTNQYGITNHLSTRAKVIMGLIGVTVAVLFAVAAFAVPGFLPLLVPAHFMGVGAALFTGAQAVAAGATATLATYGAGWAMGHTPTLNWAYEVSQPCNPQQTRSR